MIFTFLILFTVNPSDTITLQKGDTCFSTQDYPGAITIYQQYLNGTQRDAQAYWRIARANICIGDVSSKKEKESYYRKALLYSIHSVELDSMDSNVQCWYAVSMGYIALFEGSRKKVELCNKIKNALELSISIDPHNDVAFSIYGSFYRALGNVNWFERSLANLLLGGLPEGGFKESEKMLLKAIELAPNLLRHRYELGLLYFDWGKEKMGIEVFQSALTLPITLASDRRRMENMKKKLLR
jgi:tetratricopeptide (TPR) repeat protein